MNKSEKENEIDLLKFDKSETDIKSMTKLNSSKFNLTKPKKRNFKEMFSTTTSDEIKMENSKYINTLQSRKKKLTNPNQSNRTLTSRKNLNVPSDKIFSSACGRDHNKERITAKSAKNLKTSRQRHATSNNYKSRTTVRNTSTFKARDYISVDERKVQNTEFLLTEINEEEEIQKPKKKV